LLDRRDLLVGELTSLAGVEVSGKGGGDFMVTLGSKILVQGTVADELSVRAGPSGTQEVYSVSDGGTRIIPGGEIAGIMDVRDGAIPQLMTALDDLAGTLITTVNAIHVTGTTLDGAPAGDFFTAGATAADIEVASDILASPRNIATSSSGAVGNNQIALDISELRGKPLPSGQTINQLYQAIVSEAGTQSALAKHYAESQRLSLEQFTAQQQSVSGVSLDEEMADMVKFQQAYNAAARILTACDDMLSTLIEKTGLVGR
jgi:flagellar hook-associated protein 1 FlgK